jgi:hypothetical protein
MRRSISYAALAIGLVGGAAAANAQTVITDQPVETVITQQPTETVQTVRTVRTTRPVVSHRYVTTTRRTIVTQRVVLAPVVTAPVATTTVASYPQPARLYDTVAPPTVDETMFNAGPAPAAIIPTYRYVYEPDRILVIDPSTGIAIQALPR